MSQASYFSNILAKKRQMGEPSAWVCASVKRLFDVRFDKPQEFIQIA